MRNIKHEVEVGRVYLPQAETKKSNNIQGTYFSSYSSFFLFWKKKRKRNIFALLHYYW